MFGMSGALAVRICHLPRIVELPKNCQSVTNLASMRIPVRFRKLIGYSESHGISAENVGARLVFFFFGFVLFWVDFDASAPGPTAAFSVSPHH